MRRQLALVGAVAVARRRRPHGPPGRRQCAALEPLAVAAASSRGVSTWKLAAGGLQRKWKGLKQRTAWRFRTLKDKNTLIVFSADHQKEKEIHIKVGVRVVTALR